MTMCGVSPIPPNSRHCASAVPGSGASLPSQSQLTQHVMVLPCCYEGSRIPCSMHGRVHRSPALLGSALVPKSLAVPALLGSALVPESLAGPLALRARHRAQSRRVSNKPPAVGRKLIASRLQIDDPGYKIRGPWGGALFGEG